MFCFFYSFFKLPWINCKKYKGGRGGHAITGFSCFFRITICNDPDLRVVVFNYYAQELADTFLTLSHFDKEKDTLAAWEIKTDIFMHNIYMIFSQSKWINVCLNGKEYLLKKHTKWFFGFERKAP